MAQANKDDQRMSNPCYLSRMTLGDRGVSMEAFGALTGRAKSQIYKRESGAVGIPGHSLALYNLILTCSANGISGPDILEAMELVAENERSEPNAFLALIGLAIERGKHHIVSEALGRDVPPAAADEEDDVSGSTVPAMMRGMKNILRAVERQAKKSPEAAARRFREAAARMAAALYEIEQGLEELAGADAAELGDDEGGDD